MDGVKHELVATKESLGSALLSGPGNPAPVSAQNGETAALLEAIRAENYDLKERLAVAQAAAMKSPQREVVVDGDGLVPEEDFNALQEEVFSLQAELEAAQEVAAVEVALEVWKEVVPQAVAGTARGRSLQHMTLAMG